MKLTAKQRQILRAVASGVQLRDHRDIEGGKAFKLHALDGSYEAVDADDVHALVDLGLLSSNKKFPSAMYWLTEQGKALVHDDALP